MREVLRVVIILLVAGVGLWAINKFVPMDGQIKKILNVVVIVVVLVWLFMTYVWPLIA